MYMKKRFPAKDHNDRPQRNRTSEARPRQPPQESEFPGERIAKVIARAGLGSRRDAEEAIEKGRVEVNGRLITSPALNVTEQDKIMLDGIYLPQRDRTRLWLYHKPKGLVTTEKDPEGRQTVFETLPRELPRVMSVGRLDINTEGLLLLTNDGGLKRVLELPSTGWLRRYRVRAYGEVKQEQLDALKDGVEIDGVNYGPIEASIERQTDSNVWLLMGIREGKNREIKNIAAHLGLTVNRLIRVSFGPFQLRELEPGEVQEASLRSLKDQLGARLMQEANVDFSKSNTAIHPRQRLEKHSGADIEKGSATAKAERFADLQQGAMGRRVAKDNATQQLKLDPKRLRDRKGREVTVARSFRHDAGDKRKNNMAAPGIGDGSGYQKRKTRFNERSGALRGKEPARSESRFKARSDEKGAFKKRSYQRDENRMPPRSGQTKPYGAQPYRRRDEDGGDEQRSRYPRKGGERSFKKPYGERSKEHGSNRPEKCEGERHPYQKRESASGDKPFRKPYSKSSGRSSTGSQKRDGEKRPYQRDGEKRPYQRRESASGDKPFRKPYGGRSERNGSSGRPDRHDSEKRPYQRRENASGDKPFRKPYSSKKPFNPKRSSDGKSSSRGAYGKSRPSAGKKPFSRKPPRRDD